MKKAKYSDMKETYLPRLVNVVCERPLSRLRVYSNPAIKISFSSPHPSIRTKALEPKRYHIAFLLLHRLSAARKCKIFREDSCITHIIYACEALAMLG